MIREVDEIYEGVLLSRVCGRCRIRRPRVGAGWRSSKPRKVVLFQVTADGQFHMRLATARRYTALCGLEM